MAAMTSSAALLSAAGFISSAGAFVNGLVGTRCERGSAVKSAVWSARRASVVLTHASSCARSTSATPDRRDRARSGLRYVVGNPRRLVAGVTDGDDDDVPTPDNAS